MTTSKFLLFEKMNFFNLSQIKKEIFFFYSNFFFLNFFFLAFGGSIISLAYLCYLISGFTSIIFVGRYLKGVKSTDYKTDIFVILYGFLFFLILDNIILVDLALLGTFGILKLYFKKESHWKLTV